MKAKKITQVQMMGSSLILKVFQRKLKSSKSRLKILLNFNLTIPSLKFGSLNNVLQRYLIDNLKLKKFSKFRKAHQQINRSLMQSMNYRKLFRLSVEFSKLMKYKIKFISYRKLINKNKYNNLLMNIHLKQATTFLNNKLAISQFQLRNPSKSLS